MGRVSSLPYGNTRRSGVDTGTVHSQVVKNCEKGSSSVENWGNWSAPPMNNVKVRSKEYLTTKIKQQAGDVSFPLSHVDVISTNSTLIHHIANRDGEWMSKTRDNLGSVQGYTVIINLQIRSLGVSVVSYHHRQSGFKSLEPWYARLLKGLRNSTKSELDGRFKLITNLEKGPMLMRGALKAAVGANAPVVMGRAVNQRYYFGEDYMEIDVEVDTSMIARAILKVASMFIRSVVVDMVWVVEGKNETELPEKALCAVRLGNIQLSNARSLEGSSKSTTAQQMTFPQIDTSDQRQRESVLFASQAEAVQTMSRIPLPSRGSSGGDDVGATNQNSSFSETAGKHEDATANRGED
uniref:Protein ENHANCED DISEASE RESISTANCE 2 C-terminal domain-containing protein n=1 Tax=Lotharella oceanica TaxID=641309 RepID=A0A7S2U206_9EUKA|mmetsp:Transcript_6759/g.13426  ORF Transcript_6759/g.13426 Transcript_6759/m.13426 type:complete len:352 (+) Transcript_6759:167-1222(+)